MHVLFLVFFFYSSGFTKLLRNAVDNAEKNNKTTVFGYWISGPELYGVAEFDKQGYCLSFYPNKVVDVAMHIKPSARELKV